MCHVDSTDATLHVRRALRGVPLATKEMEDFQGSLTLWFHEFAVLVFVFVTRTKTSMANTATVYGVSDYRRLRAQRRHTHGPRPSVWNALIPARPRRDHQSHC
jgi:hypothetical protein